MSEFVILLGIGKSGKTTFAREFEQQGYKRISIDSIFRYNTGISAWHHMTGHVIKLLNQNPDTNFVLDGYINACTCKETGRRIYTGHGFDFLQDRLRHHKIKPIVVVQSKKILYERGSKETEERISWLYAWFLTMRGIDTIVTGSTGNPVVATKDQAMSFVLDQEEPATPTKIGSQHILEKLKRRKTERAPHHGDPYYQTIELGGGLKVKGYNGNHEHTTWNKIKDHLDVKGKNVAEVGCHHGFYLLAMKEAGALRADGYDYNPWTVESAEQIAHFKELDVRYYLLNIDLQKLPDIDYDIILVMNALRHFKNPNVALREVFEKTKQHIVFETQYDLEALRKSAVRCGFKEVQLLPGRKHSKKKERMIIFFERE